MHCGHDRKLTLNYHLPQCCLLGARKSRTFLCGWHVCEACQGRADPKLGYQRSQRTFAASKGISEERGRPSLRLGGASAYYSQQRFARDSYCRAQHAKAAHQEAEAADRLSEKDKAEASHLDANRDSFLSASCLAQHIILAVVPPSARCLPQVSLNFLGLTQNSMPCIRRQNRIYHLSLT